MAAGDMYILRVDGKVIKAFQSVGVPLVKVKEYMKQNNIQGVGELTNNRTNGKFIVTAKDSVLDEAIRNIDRVPLADTKFLNDNCRRLFEDLQLAKSKKDSSRIEAVIGTLRHQEDVAKELYREGKLEKSQVDTIVKTIERVINQ